MTDFPIPETWTFQSSDVADAFDAHVREQLPWYDLVTSAVVQIARHYVGRGARVYDIGASNGNVGRALATLLTDREASLIGIEQSRVMAEAYDAPGDVVVCNAEDYDYRPFDFGVAMLALMFLHPADVEPLLERLRYKLRPGGALVVVERTLPPGGYPGIVRSRLTLAAKAASGASGAAIVAKELSLAGVQRPLDPDLLTRFGAVEWFRFGDFAGYVIEGDR